MVRRGFFPVALIGIIAISLIIAVSYPKNPDIGAKPDYAPKKHYEQEIEKGVKTWAKIIERYGHQALYSIEQTKDGGYIATGPFGRNGTETPTGHQAHDAYLLKLDSDGNEVWEKNISPTTGIGSTSTDIHQTSDEGYVIVGMTKFESDPSAEWVYIVKTDEQGTKVWDKAYFLFKNIPRHDNPSSVQETSDGGYIIGGETDAFFGTTNAFPPNREAFLLKTDKYGSRLWEKHYGGDGMEDVSAVQQTSDGGYIIGGTTWSYNQTKPEDTHAYLVKTDAEGNKLWERVIDAFDEHEQDEIESIQQTSDGGYIMAGVTVCDTASNSGCAYLLKVDEDGNRIWENTYKECETSTLFQVQETSDGGYVATGYVGGLDCIDDWHPTGVTLLKTNENGSRVWQKKFGWYKLASEAYRANNDAGGVMLMGRSVEQTSDGGYIIAGYVGYSKTSPWQDDIILIKTDGNGNVEGYKR